MELVNQLEVEVEIMRAAGLKDGEIARLALLKRRVDRGQCDDLTMEFKRLSFARFLYEAGKINDNYPW